ncbi:MAG: signal peptidase I [Clostridiales bacterium]|nr:signal peptidase I [Clostridiales bacterium]
MEQHIPEGANIPSEEAVAAERERLQYQKRYRQTLRTTIYALVVVAAAAVLLATLFLPVLQVSGSSMEPTLEDGDIILLVKTDSFDTGDLVGFYYQNKLLLKRVIAGPGDIVDIDDEGNVSVNGEVLDEPYLNSKALGETDIVYPYQVPENRYFVMGDNRLTSIDSRSSAIGCIEEEQIVGRVILRVLPLNRIAIIQ